MRKLALLVMFGFAMLSAGCSVDELTLTDGEVDELVENFEGAIEAYSELSEFTLNVALGDEDIEGYDYTPPSELNGWTGTLSFTGAALPTSTGDLTITFQVLADGTPIDPYETPLTLEDLETLSVSGSIAYEGTSTAGASLSADGTFSWAGTFDDLTNEGELTLNGVFYVTHNNYASELVPSDFTFHMDLDDESISEVTGVITGSVDIPDFYFDADLDVLGNGTDLEATVDIVGNEVTVIYPLEDL